ncbi:Bol3p [Ascoidea rubescens DSM 1968]|uniref:Bola-like protein n=1 Tax=Ascoidea rubescens DSM 1968 TaxID=1344418 RepID=A0A1D2VNY0_9ASCO|nr:bola-like protein [Ascoidea rubescens DSM 1968]ODV63306.1 bola-like protein [Ascoidea rubescens DSM 1968]
MGEYEKELYFRLKKEFEPDLLDVMDVSGGCGTMFVIDISSRKFRGITMIKQHRMVNEFLKEDIAKWHGLQLKTKAIQD